MIENTYDNCKKLAKFSASVKDLEGLLQFYQHTLFLQMRDSQKEFDFVAMLLDINSQEELDKYASQRLDGDK